MPLLVAPTVFPLACGRHPPGVPSIRDDEATGENRQGRHENIWQLEEKGVGAHLQAHTWKHRPRDAADVAG